MIILLFIVLILAGFWMAFALFLTRRLWRWEKQLRGARVAISRRGRVEMDPTLYELLTWALAVERDKTRTGKRIYQGDKISVSILQPRHKSHGKSTTHIV